MLSPHNTRFKLPPAWLLVLTCMLVAMPPLLVRTGLNLSLGDLLWAEDGKVFLRDAQSLGWSAIFKPYEGYLHLYPRLIAAVNAGLDPAWTPWTYAAGWLAAYLYLMVTAARVALRHGGGLAGSMLLVLALAIQPNNGEVILSLTNSQWMLGTALVLQVLFEPAEVWQARPERLLGLLLLGLTGPYAILLLPTLGLKCILQMPFRQRVAGWGVLILCGAIQLGVLATSNRMGKVNTWDTSPLHWALALVSPLVLAPHTLFQAGLALLLMAWVGWHALKQWRANGASRALVLNTVIALFFTVGFVAATLLAFKHAPLDVFHPHAKNRYSWVTCSVLVTAAFLLVQQRPAMNLIFVALAMGIWGEWMDRLDREALHYESMVNLSRYTDLSIPINPKWAAYPGWHVAPPPPSQQAALTEREVSNDEIRAGLVSMKARERWVLKSPTAQDLARLTWACETSGDIGVEVLGQETVWHAPEEGWVEVVRTAQWPSHSVRESMKRWPPVGPVRLAYGFSHTPEARLQLQWHAPASMQVQALKVYCLPHH